MLNIRHENERGHTKIDWLDSRHTFSFGSYTNSDFQSFRALRVLNDDRVTPGMGFGTHSHRDMEIITVVTEGTLAHKDSLGSSSVMNPGDVQVMSAGTGITHSEFNGSRTAPLRFIQIWIQPERKAGEPAYEQRHFPQEERRGALRLIASRDGRKESLQIQQDVNLYASSLAPGEKVSLPLPPDHHAWVQVVRGNVSLSGERLQEGDGAAVSDEPRIELTTDEGADLLLFDLA